MFHFYHFSRFKKSHEEEITFLRKSNLRKESYVPRILTSCIKNLAVFYKLLPSWAKVFHVHYLGRYFSEATYLSVFILVHRFSFINRGLIQTNKLIEFNLIKINSKNIVRSNKWVRLVAEKNRILWTQKLFCPLD